MNATENVQVLSSFRQPKKISGQQRGHRRAAAVEVSIFTFEKKL